MTKEDVVDENRKLSLDELVTVLKDVLEQHTGLSQKLSRSIVCTFIEQMTIGCSSMVADANHGGINAVVYYESEN